MLHREHLHREMRQLESKCCSALSLSLSLFLMTFSPSSNPLKDKYQRLLVLQISQELFVSMKMSVSKNQTDDECDLSK